MRLRMLLLSGGLWLYFGAMAAQSQDIEDIRREIEASPFLSSGPMITDLDLREGYLLASVLGLGGDEVAGLRSNKPLSMLVNAGPKIASLKRVESMLLERFDLKDIFWTPIPSIPDEHKRIFERLALMGVDPGVSIGGIRIGDQFAVASSAIGAEVVRDTPDLRTSRINLGTATFYIYARGGPQITGLRFLDAGMFRHGLHGLRELRTMKEMFPRTAEGIGLGSTDDEVIAAFGPPDSRSGRVGGCGVQHRPDETLRYPGMSLRVCDGIVADIRIE